VLSRGGRREVRPQCCPVDRVYCEQWVAVGEHLVAGLAAGDHGQVAVSSHAAQCVEGDGRGVADVERVDALPLAVPVAPEP
jgi:hypothetical protein